MAEKTKRVSALAILLIALLSAMTTVHAKEAQILCIYWRGKTQIDQRFRDGLQELGIHADFTEFDADKDRVALSLQSSHFSVRLQDNNTRFP